MGHCIGHTNSLTDIHTELKIAAGHRSISDQMRELTNQMAKYKDIVTNYISGNLAVVFLRICCGFPKLWLKKA